MENVVAFNNELSGLYDSKPPISKAKMAAITRAAMRAIKFYKHVVQSVEKFILKCKPEYKVPGLYVIDSIVRQSRHQFGPEKDVFAPRFARNIKETFANLFRCAPEDKSRIIRVLNLWQKNNVFAPEVIQPIFDLADPNHPIYQLQPVPAATTAATGGGVSSTGNIPGVAMNDMPVSANGLHNSVASVDMNISGSGSAAMGSAHSGSAIDDKIAIPDLSSLSHEKVQNVLDNSTLKQLEHMQQYLKRQTCEINSSTGGPTSMKTSSHDVYGMHSTSRGGNYCNIIKGFEGKGSSSGNSSSKNYNTDGFVEYSKRSHDFGNGDIFSGDNTSSTQASNLLDTNNLKQLLNDPNVLRQLQTLQNFQKFKQQEDKQNKFNEMRLQQEQVFEKHLQNVLKVSSTSTVMASSGGSGTGNDSSDLNKEVEFISEERKIEVITLDGNDSRSPTPDRYIRRRSRSRSRERSGGRGSSRDRRRRSRTRSRSRSRSPRSSRRRSSRDRANREKEREREREHERERRRKGLPDIKKEHLSVCSTTLWVGHLSKLVCQEELSDTFGEFGDIISIDQIVPRGCAFIVMNRRQDAYKAMQTLKNHKLQGRTITISWAAGKGVKSKDWKDFWDLELGVTYIPWSKLDLSTDFDSLEEGGMFDEDSMPAWMKDKIKHMKSIKAKGQGPVSAVTPLAPPPPLMFSIDTTQPPPAPPRPLTGPPAPPPALMNMMGPPGGQYSIVPPMAGGPAPRAMLGPMTSGIGPLSGIPMPPPYPMMAPGMMPPGYPPMIPGQIEKARGIIPGADGIPPLGPPPISQYMPMGGPHSIGLPPAGPSHFPTHSDITSATMTAASASSNDDQMDIEMDEDDGSSNAAGMVFHQPPPMGHSGVAIGHASAIARIGEEGRGDNSSDYDRRGSAANTQWSGRGGDTVESEGSNNSFRNWNENGGGDGGHDRLQNYGEDGREGGSRNTSVMNMSPLDMNTSLQRPEFMDDFNNRGPRGGQGGNPNGDFLANNMQNRFNQPASLLQLRIPPPTSFNPRMNGPPMFMRGQGGGGCVRPQGFFNDRGQFDRSGRGTGGGMGRTGRGGRQNNWRDDDGDNSGVFKRRMQGNAAGGNRYRDGCMDDRYGGRGGGGRRGGAQRGGDRDRREDNDRGGRSGDDGNSQQSRDDRFDNSTGPSTANENPAAKPDAGSESEEDWDRDLDSFNDSSAINKPNTHTIFSDNLEEFTNTEDDKNSNSNKESSLPENCNRKSGDGSIAPGTIRAPPLTQNTPLYDELPPPVASRDDSQGNEMQQHNTSTPNVRDTETEEPMKA